MADRGDLVVRGSTEAVTPLASQIEQLRRLAIDPLDPAHLTPEAATAIENLRRGDYTDNTLETIDSAMRYWSAWYAVRYGRVISLPVSVPSTLQFIADHVAVEDPATGALVHQLPDDVDRILRAFGRKKRLGRPSLSTVLLRLSILSMVHQELRLPNPTEHKDVRDALSGARKRYAKRRLGPKGKDALTAEHLKSMLATCGSSPRGVRDYALLTFAFNTGGRRRSEVADAHIEDISVRGKGFVFRLGPSKTDPEGKAEGRDKAVKGEAARALAAWLELRGMRSGPLFCRIDRNAAGEEELLHDEKLPPDSIRRMVMRRARAAGLEGLDITPHSIRSGFITESGRQNKPIFETMLATGHKTMEMPKRYYRAGNVMQSPVADLLGSSQPDEPEGG